MGVRGRRTTESRRVYGDRINFGYSHARLNSHQEKNPSSLSSPLPKGSHRYLFHELYSNSNQPTVRMMSETIVSIPYTFVSFPVAQKSSKRVWDKCPQAKAFSKILMYIRESISGRSIPFFMASGYFSCARRKLPDNPDMRDHTAGTEQNTCSCERVFWLPAIITLNANKRVDIFCKCLGVRGVQIIRQYFRVSSIITPFFPLFFSLSVS